MHSVTGTFKNGVVELNESVSWTEGQEVTITVAQNDRPDNAQPMTDEDWDKLDRALEECKMETGITDLAHQHDHYLYGTPKKEPPLEPEGKVTIDDLLEFIEEYAIDTGIEDLAHQHDHYLYGTPKTDRYPE